MAKVVVTPITNGNNVSSINNNFATLAAALNDGALWRDNPPSTANQVENDIDMNSNNLLNVGLIDAEDFTIGGENLDQGLVATVTQAAATAVAASATAVAAANSATAITAGALQKTNNLSDLGSIATAKANLGLVKADVGLGNVDNTSDVNKPVSTATQTALNLKANIAGQAFTGAISSTGVISNTDTTQSSGSGTGAIVTLGGIGVAKNANVGGTLGVTGVITAGAAINATGQITSTTTINAGSNLTIIGAQNTSKNFFMQNTGGASRWVIYTDGSTESGSNAGANFNIARYNDAGTLIDNPVIISRASGAVVIKGATSGNPITAGYVGEYVTSTNAGVGLSTSTNGNVVALALTAGEWDVSGVVHYIPNSTTSFLRAQQGMSTTSLTMPGLGAFTTNFVQATNSGNPDHVTPTVRVRSSVSFTVYLVANAVFTVSTMSCDGFVRATRVA